MKIEIERQAMQVALNALERTQSEPGSLEFEIQEEAMDALREALAAPQKQLDDISVVNMGALPAQQSIPDGYVLVPAELTKEMRAAAKPCTTVSALWASIIAAAPNPAQLNLTTLNAATMDMLRQQSDRIAELEDDVKRLRSDTMNKKTTQRGSWPAS